MTRGETMENYFFMRPLLKKLGQPAFVNRTVSRVIRVCVALIVLGSLASFFSAGKVIFSLPNTSAIFGGIVFQLFFIMAIYSVSHVLVIRAKDIKNLPGHLGSVYMLPVAAILVRMLGEAYAGFIALLAIGGGIFVWFTGLKVGAILGPVTTFFPTMRDASFIGGIEFMVTGTMIAIAVIIVSYMVAEVFYLLARFGDKPMAVTHQLSRQDHQRIDEEFSHSNDYVARM